MRARALVAMGVVGSFGSTTVGCGAGLREGSYAQRGRREAPPAQLVVSASERKELASSDAGVVAVTFENRTGRPLRVREVRLDFGAAERDQAIEIPLGPDLEIWAESLRRRAMRDERREAAAIGLLALGGLFLVLAATSSSGGGDVSLTGLHLRGPDPRAEATAPDPLPASTHLFTPGLVLPPGQLVERWVLIHTVSGRVGHVGTALLELVFDDGSRGAARLSFRDGGCRSAWQRTLCR